MRNYFVEMKCDACGRISLMPLRLIRFDSTSSCPLCGEPYNLAEGEATKSRRFLKVPEKIGSKNKNNTPSPSAA
jgi:hypothetical protein